MWHVTQSEEGKALTGERKRCVERKLRNFRRLGVHLEGAVADQVKAILTRISELGVPPKSHL